MKKINKIKIKFDEKSDKIQIIANKSKTIIVILSKNKKRKPFLENWYKKLNEFVEDEKVKIE